MVLHRLLSPPTALSKLLAKPFTPATGKSVTDSIKDAVATIGENMALRRSAALSVEHGVVATYIHNAAGDGIGKLGVLVALKSVGDKAVLTSIGRQVAMHIAATNPLAIRAEEVDQAAADRERAIFIEQPAPSGKPDSIIEKMVDGRMRKFFEEVALLSQAFVVNPDLTVGAAVKEAEKEAGAAIEVVGMAPFCSAKASRRKPPTSQPKLLPSPKG